MSNYNEYKNYETRSTYDDTYSMIGSMINLAFSKNWEKGGKKRKKCRGKHIRNADTACCKNICS